MTMFDDMTVFESERIKMIPFGVHFGKDRRDPYLKNRLQTPESLSGVLNWCIEGLQAIRAEGFKEPPAVVQATDEYRRKMDKLLQFLEEKAEVNPAFEITLGELHTAFANWCSASGLMPVSVPKFKELLEERQIFTKRKRPAGSGRAVWAERSQVTRTTRTAGDSGTGMKMASSLSPKRAV